MNGKLLEEHGNELKNGNELKKRCVRSALKTGIAASAATLGALATANALIGWNTPTVGPRLGGGFNRYPTRFGDGVYFVAGKDEPLLLLHALRAGNSSAEWEDNFQSLAERHTVHALDFLGWGLSDKPRHVLRAADYAEQIQHFVEDVIGADMGTPVAVIASGQSCELALLAAQSAPHLFSKFVFVCPVAGKECSSPVAGENEYDADVNDDEAKRRPLYRLFSLPIIGQSILNAMTSRAAIKAAQGKLYFDKTRMSSGEVARLHISAHQRGAQGAWAAQKAGLLDVAWHEKWSALPTPALLAWGRHAVPDGYETAPEWLALNPDAELMVFNEAAWLPHIECAEEWNARILDWLAP